jgi:trehalose 6-phosphate phosphatase
LTDVDGTISRMTQRPMDATVTPEARQSLRRLAQKLDLVAVVTGRAVSRAQEMVGLPEITYVGNHGFEWTHGGAVETLPEAVAARPALDGVLAAIRAVVPEDGLAVEDKGVTLAVHYRLAPDHALTRERMLAAVAPYLADGSLRLIEGGLVFNLLPNVTMDKGEAAVRLVERHGLKSVAFFGDDVTDIDAFRALRRLRDEGRANTLSVGVLSPEGPAALRDHADILLDGVHAVERVLAALAADH